MSRDFLDLDPQNRLDPKRGRLLVSEPFLSDPYFRRTVVLLCEHNQEGSFGFVLNRYLDMDIGDLMENMPPIRTRIGIGGPVQSGNLYYLHTIGARVEGSLEVVDGVFMGGDFEQLRDLLNTEQRLGDKVRFFVGYSGWSEDQLDRELSERSWLVAEAKRRHIMDTRLNDIWGDTLRHMGREYAPLANFPDDPTLN
ncbi:MAG: YqgE/AlgH family protein [Flavobacteriales bacterium]|nr:YqgE/AlgH family protein [Flavobacteriales bacterium]